MSCTNFQVIFTILLENKRMIRIVVTVKLQMRCTEYRVPLLDVSKTSPEPVLEPN